MGFIEMRDLLVEHFNKMVADPNVHLFEAVVDKEELWNLYLDSFLAGTNEISRTRREYDCSCCRHFIKSIGNAVVIKDNKVETIWEFETNDPIYQPVLNALDNYIKAHVVSDVFVAKFSLFGAKKTHAKLVDGKVEEWDHFYLEMPERLVNNSHRSEGDMKGELRAIKEVFKRSLDEITLESVDTVLDLISQNSLYKGAEWKKALEVFRKYKVMYAKVPEEEKNNFAWEKSLKAGLVVCKIRNHSMGVLLTNISEGMELDKAVTEYERITAPSNYKRPKSIFTKKMLEDAQKTITELGYLDSLGRRYATLDDITVNDILFSNKDSAKRISGAEAIFADMAKEVPMNPKKFSRVEEVPIEKFVSDILPTARELEVFLENRHTGNMVSLIASQVRDSKTMFKWDNNFGWAYSGNMTDSMKERVKAAGGKVDGVLRFSIQWNDTKEYSRNDLDAHCQEPKGGTHIYYASNAKKPGRSKFGGRLDVDITNPRKDVPAVENITWVDKSIMKPGVYKFWVHQFSNRGGKDGFRAEIECGRQLHQYDYSKELRQSEEVAVAEVTLHEDGTFTIKDLLPTGTSSREIWNLHTNQFVPVSVVCLSPNYWCEGNGTGNKHYFFMLKDCVNPERPNGFYNEFLKPELEQHRRVFEALGSKIKVEDVEDQLSGLGFSSTQKAELIVKVKGTTERIVKVKF